MFGNAARRGISVLSFRATCQFRKRLHYVASPGSGCRPCRKPQIRSRLTFIVTSSTSRIHMCNELTLAWHANLSSGYTHDNELCPCSVEICFCLTKELYAISSLLATLRNQYVQHIFQTITKVAPKSDSYRRFASRIADGLLAFRQSVGAL